MSEQSKERRILEGSEFRVVREDGADSGESGQPRIEGYAAVFDQESLDLGGFREVIHKGAFSETIEIHDIRGLINHDANLVLGRNRAGTLELREDDHGLAFVLYPPKTAAARDLLVSMERGDVDQMSFMFEAERDRWETTEQGALRHLLQARLFEVSVVTFPAYPQTSAQARAQAQDLSEPAPAEDGGDGGQEDGGKLQARRRRNRARLDLALRA